MKLAKLSGAFTKDTSLYLWIIAVFVVIISFFNYMLGLAGVLVLIYLVVHNMRTATRKKEELRLYIENLSDNVDIATKNAILNLPFPLVIVDEQGLINWYNMQFSDIFQGEYILDKKLSSYLNGIDLGRILKNGTEEFKYVNIKDRYYDIYCNMINLKENSSESNVIIMYLVDKTDYINIRNSYNDDRPVIAALQLDNYDEVLKDVEDVAKPAIIAEVDRRINAWASLNNASIQKYSNSEYILHFTYKQLVEMEEKRFDILDSMREINSGNRIPITISIGVGVNGKSLVELQSFSHSAMDIALGRGGDQAVVKDNDKLSFYGGKTKAVEKRTRVKARVMAYALRQLIEQSENVIILGHEMPDLDCLGSALGIYRCCANLNKDVKIVLNRVNAAIANLWSELEEDEEYNNVFVNSQEAAQLCSRNTLLVIVDVHRPGFTECRQLLERTEKIVVIDHHRRGTEFIDNAVLTYIEPYASSTSELVTEMLQYMFEKSRIKQIEAEALLAGIFIDTKNFSFQTGVRTFEAASFLRKVGADTTLTRQLFQDDMETFLTRADVVKKASMFRNNIAISTIPHSAKYPALVAAQAADELLNIKGINASFVLSEINGDIFISGRSLGDINVQVVLEKLGGGGHLTVAGAQLPGASIEEAIDKVKKAVDEYLREGE
ncbi:MAG: phosphoesterase [Clostridia bacterium]|jgi:c-di-AMP phosphodiesterase-like protein|nr:phosphoesterase [Clostridia bacterium]